jgi:hypothetical protein
LKFSHAKLTPHYWSMLAGSTDSPIEGMRTASGRRGAFRGNSESRLCAFACSDEYVRSRAAMSRVQIRGGNGMKEATKRATSEALAHMLAVTAMLVIASILFYSHH